METDPGVLSVATSNCLNLTNEPTLLMDSHLSTDDQNIMQECSSAVAMNVYSKSVLKIALAKPSLILQPIKWQTQFDLPMQVIRPVQNECDRSSYTGWWVPCFKNGVLDQALTRHKIANKTEGEKQALEVVSFVCGDWQNHKGVIAEWKLICLWTDRHLKTTIAVVAANDTIMHQKTAQEVLLMVPFWLTWSKLFFPGCETSMQNHGPAEGSGHSDKQILEAALVWPDD